MRLGAARIYRGTLPGCGAGKETNDECEHVAGAATLSGHAPSLVMPMYNEESVIPLLRSEIEGFARRIPEQRKNLNGKWQEIKHSDLRPNL